MSKKKLTFDTPFDLGCRNISTGIDERAEDKAQLAQLLALGYTALELLEEKNILEGESSLSGHRFSEREVFDGELIPSISEQHLDNDEQFIPRRGMMHIGR